MIAVNHHNSRVFCLVLLYILYLYLRIDKSRSLVGDSLCACSASVGFLRGLRL